MMKWVETFNAHQRLATEALDKANKENGALKYEMQKLRLRAFDLIEKVERARRKAQCTGSELEKHYIANFHLTEVYQSFAK